VTGLDRNTSVFVNCPFDAEYRPALEAVVYTSVAAGLYPVLGSRGPIASPRTDRILTALKECRYSIHDLSRCRGEGSENLARFNMPLELGMAMALRGVTPTAVDAHEYLILVPDEAYIYQRFVSDLSGLDPLRHDGTPTSVTARVLSWLVSLTETPAPLAPPEVLSRLGVFSSEWAALDREWDGSTPWSRVVEKAAEIAS